MGIINPWKAPIWFFCSNSKIHRWFLEHWTFCWRPIWDPYGSHMGPIWVVLWFWRGCTWFSHNLYAVQSSNYNLYLYQIDEMYQEDCIYMNRTARNILNVSVDLWNFIIWFGHVPYGAHMGPIWDPYGSYTKSVTHLKNIWDFQKYKGTFFRKWDLGSFESTWLKNQLW